MGKKYVFRSTLNTVYGMTPSMIRELGEPDNTCENPNWKTGPYDASLYLKKRVEVWVENNQDRLKKAKESRERRSAAMKVVHEKKQAERRRLEQRQMRLEQERLKKDQQWLRTLPITFKKPLPRTLRTDALKGKKFSGNVAVQEERTLRNHVRHRYTNYDKLLKEVSQKESPYKLYPLLRELVDAVVEDALAKWEATVEAMESTSDNEGE